MAFDRHMNLVLGDAEEFRKLPPKKGRSEEEVHYITSSDLRSFLSVILVVFGKPSSSDGAMVLLGAA